MIELSDLKAKAFSFVLKYKMRLTFVTGTLAWIILLKAVYVLIPVTPLVRLGLIYSFAVLFIGFAACFSQLLATPISFSVAVWWYNRRHKPEATEFPELAAIAAKMGLAKLKKIQLTDNPQVKSAYTNMTTGTITVPRSWKDYYTLEQLIAISAHEIAHLRTKKQSYLDMMVVVLVTCASAMTIGFFEATIFAQVGALAVFYLLLAWALRRNEYRADKVAADYVGPDQLIGVFEDFISKGYTEGSETHPSPKKRIGALRRYFAKKSSRRSR